MSGNVVLGVVVVDVDDGIDVDDDVDDGVGGTTAADATTTVVVVVDRSVVVVRSERDASATVVGSSPPPRVDRPNTRMKTMSTPTTAAPTRCCWSSRRIHRTS